MILEIDLLVAAEPEIPLPSLGPENNLKIGILYCVNILESEFNEGMCTLYNKYPWKFREIDLLLIYFQLRLALGNPSADDRKTPIIEHGVA